MVNRASPTIQVRAFGPLACFTRPELKVERMSYPVMTPSAARGMLDAVLWKPQMRWRIERIHVLRDIRFVAFRRNEVNGKAVAPKAAVIAYGGPAPVLFADEDRAQRNTVALADVDYIVDARIELTPKSGPDDSVTKYAEMFARRLEKGQHFHQPYFGCREFVAALEPAPASFEPIGDSRDLGRMLWDIAYGERNVPHFFEARLDRGVLEVPPAPEGEEAAA